MGRMQRYKGRRGQKEFAGVLTRKGWEILESATGAKAEDFLGVLEGKMYSIEVKYHKLICIDKFLRQTREQAARRKGAEWMLACRLTGFPNTFLVITSEGAEVWK